MDGVTKIPLEGATQAGIVFARRGIIGPDNETDYARLPLVYHIVFHSLGSRVYKIRQKTGLFYSASGSLAHAATATSPGMDFVSTAVEPTLVQTALREFRALFQGLAEAPAVKESELAAAKRWYETLTENRLHNAPALCATYMLYKRLYPERTYDAVLKDHLAVVQDTQKEDIDDLVQRVFSPAFEHVFVTTEATAAPSA